MPTSRTVLYTDTLFFDALVRAISDVTAAVEVATFVFKSSYEQPTRAQQVMAALKAKAASGVPVYVVLNYSRFEPDVCVDNYLTGQELAAAGCRVCLGPRNTTLHAKLAIVDYGKVFVGSHNLTRGALSFNRELSVYTQNREIARRAVDYFNALWNASTRIDLTAPPPSAGAAVEIALAGVTTEGAAVTLSFSVNNTQGVEAFGALADDSLTLTGARLGETVAATARSASVTPDAEDGDTLFVAVRAYRSGAPVATSNVLQMTYHPTEAPQPPEPPEPPTPPEPPPPEPLTAPTLASAVWASPTEVTLTWEFVGCATFHHFAVERRSLEQNWVQIGSTFDAAARQWTGLAPGSTEATPFRVVVYNQAGESAASNLMTVSGEPPQPLVAPTLVTAQQTAPQAIRLEWTYTTPQSFHRFEVQERTDATTWQTLATLMDPAVREWEGTPPFMDVDHPVRLVVFDMTERSAASDEVTITLLPALQAPVLTVVETVTLEQIHVEWTYETPENFDRFEIQQRVAEATWQAIAAVTAPTARSWNGSAPNMDDVHPIRVVVFNTAEQSAASNEMPIAFSVFAPPVPPVIVSITPYEAGVRVVWTWEDSGRFSHFVIQQRDEAQVWHDLATVRGPSDREWIGQPLDMSTTHPYRVMVYNITGESAVSEEGFLTMG